MANYRKLEAIKKAYREKIYSDSRSPAVRKRSRGKRRLYPKRELPEFVLEQLAHMRSIQEES